MLLSEAKPPIPRSSVPRPTSIGSDGGGSTSSLGIGRSSGIPQPTTQNNNTAEHVVGTAVHSLEERFLQCRSENGLLGQLLQDCQAECTRLKKQQKQDKKKQSSLQEGHKARLTQLQNELQQSKQAAQEIKKVKSTASSQAASLRRQDERQRQLEDIIVDLKHDLDAAKASEQAAVAEAASLKKDLARKELRFRQSAAAANRARDELACEKENRNNAVAAGHGDLQATLKQVQQQADEVTHAVKQAHDAQTRELKVRLEQLQAEQDSLQEQNSELIERVQCLSAQNQDAGSPARTAGALVVSSSSGSLEAAVAELQTRNHRLQMALARKSTAEDKPERQMIVAAKGQQRYLQQVCSAQQGELEAQQTQQHVHSQQDLINVTDRLTAVVQLNAEVLADNSKLTQQLQAAEQRTLDARQNLAAVERLKDTCPRTSHGTGPSKLLQTCERSSSSCCNAVVFEHHTRCPDIQQTSIRILEDENQQLAGSVEDLKHRMQECVLAEHKARQMLQEARSREGVAAQRLADEAARVHTLELMRLNDLREMNRLRSCEVLHSQGSGKLGSGFNKAQVPGHEISVDKASSLSDQKLKHMRSLQSMYSSGSMDYADVPLSLQAIAGLQ